MNKTILISFIAAIAAAATITATTASAPSAVLISEVYADTMMNRDIDEFIALQNYGDHPVNISGWSISDGEGTLILNFTIQPHQKIYITRNVSAFEAQADEIGISLNAFARICYGGLHRSGMFALRNAGDEIVLRDAHRNLVDSLAFGDSEGCDGWHDAPLRKPPEGYMLKRRCSIDTDRRCDWVILPVHMPCFTAETFHIREACAFVSPDCSFDVLAGEISNASSSILINTYEFESFALKDALKNAMIRGIDVKILMEGAPIGGMSDDAIAIMKELSDAGADIRLSKNRAVNHAKYVIIDGESVIVMTENFKDSGIPKAKTYGNRGYGVVLRGEKIAEHFKTLFYADFNIAESASVRAANAVYATNAASTALAAGFGYEPVFKPLCVEQISVRALIAPDNMLDAMLRALDDADSRIYVEIFSAERVWDDRNSCAFACRSSDKDNPILSALIDAARRGCDVKLLLDANEYNLRGHNDNDDVVKWLNDVAKRENLSIKAEIVDLKSLNLLKIHCKCAVIDDKVLISSMNWRSGATCNREVGVIVESERIADYYADVFMHDWNMSCGAAGGDAAVEVDMIQRIVGIALTFAASIIIFMIIRRYRS